MSLESIRRDLLSIPAPGSTGASPRLERAVGAAVVVLAVMHATTSVQAQEFSSFITAGPSFAQIDIPLGAPPLPSIYEDEEEIELAVGFDYSLTPHDPMEAASIHRYQVKWDPYLAARIRVTNLRTVAQPVTFSVRMPMMPVPTPATPPFATFTGGFSVTLTDTSGDGVASYTGGGAGFALSHILGASLTASHAVSLTEPGTVNVYDLGPVPVPGSVTGQWTRLELAHLASSPVGSLSPGDTVEYYVFGCVALPATSCPSPPALPLPEPAAGVMPWAGLGLLAAWRARRRPRAARATG